MNGALYLDYKGSRLVLARGPLGVALYNVANGEGVLDLVNDPDFECKLPEGLQILPAPADIPYEPPVLLEEVPPLEEVVEGGSEPTPEPEVVEEKPEEPKEEVPEVEPVAEEPVAEEPAPAPNNNTETEEEEAPVETPDEPTPSEE